MNTLLADNPHAQFVTRQASPDLVSVRSYIYLGCALLVLLVGGIGGWAMTTDLAGAVMAPGTVVVSSNVKKIQHPTGGVIGTIYVKNGDRVRAGDPLLRLDETVTKANVDLITKQLDELRGQEARLTAERDDSDHVTFPDDLSSRSAATNVAQILSGEQALFNKRTSALHAQLQQLGERVSGLNEEISGTTAQVAAKTKEIDLINKELASLAGLEAQQLVTTSKMMALRREAARLEGERAELNANIGQSKQKIAEIKVQRLALENQAKSDVVKELRDVQGKISELSERRVAAADQLKRVALISPVNGIVDQLSVFTIGGVINAGEQVMVIVPDDDKLVIEARITQRDIEQAHANQAATIRMTAFDQRTTPTVEGNLTTIAADVSRDPQTGSSYFLARVAIPEPELKKLGDHKLIAGMPVEVQIKTASRTALSYLLKPLSDQFAQAFKER
jgi:HlyD family secretion protein